MKSKALSILFISILIFITFLHVSAYSQETHNNSIDKLVENFILAYGCEISR